MLGKQNRNKPNFCFCLFVLLQYGREHKGTRKILTKKTVKISAPKKDRTKKFIQLDMQSVLILAS